MHDSQGGISRRSLFLLLAFPGLIVAAPSQRRAPAQFTRQEQGVALLSASQELDHPANQSKSPRLIVKIHCINRAGEPQGVF